MPDDIDDTLAGCGLSLFPKAGDLATTCSCPDHANPCKHVAAVHYVLAQAFDDDPFLLPTLRGRDQHALLAALRAARTGAGSSADPALEDDSSGDGIRLADLHAARLYDAPGDLAAVAVQPAPPTDPGASLRRLGPPPLGGAADRRRPAADRGPRRRSRLGAGVRRHRTTTGPAWRARPTTPCWTNSGAEGRPPPASSPMRSAARPRRCGPRCGRSSPPAPSNGRATPEAPATTPRGRHPLTLPRGDGRVSVVSDGLMAIGTFSRASLLSVKALRAYHEAGILVPARIDPATGYRSYHATQLTDAAVIQRLRALDVPLDRVREVVHARDPAVTQRVLTEHTAAMQARLEDVTRIVSELQAGVGLPAAHTPVHVRDEPAAHTLAVRGEVTEASFAAFLDGAYAELRAMVERLGTAPVGPTGALYPPEIADDDRRARRGIRARGRRRWRCPTNAAGWS